MRRRIICLVMGVIFSCPQVLFSATIHVPAGQPTIQAGINAAVNGDTFLADTLVDNFDGTTLHERWRQIGGVASDIAVSNGWLSIRGITDGIFDGAWNHLYLRTAFRANQNFEVNLAYIYPAISGTYNWFRIDLLDSAGAKLLHFWIWDTPTQWIIIGEEGGPCSISKRRNNDFMPIDAEIVRTNDTVYFSWSDSLQLKCYSTDTVYYLQFDFARYQSTFCGALVDSIKAISYPDRPIVLDFLINNEAPHFHMTNHQPSLTWNYFDENSVSQDSFHVQIGTDPDWTYAEMWNPGPVASSDTFVTYAGAPLLDGETYYLRLRVHNGTVWSAWYDTLFRMNSLPSVPSPLSPANEEVVTETFPTLYIQNATDAEGDSLTYDFYVVKWNPLGPPFDPFVDSVDNFEGQDSTGWTVPGVYPLEDNQKYFWMARSFDQFEKSGWSDPLRSFWVNTEEEAPWPFDLISPPDTGASIIFDMLPQFYWRIVTEPDPFDNVTHTLYLAIDSNFQFVQTIGDIPVNYHDLSDSLWFGTRYWWKVRAQDANENSTFSTNVLSFRTWKLGDANGDWVVNILDVTFLISALYKGGNQPSPAYVGDANGNCVTNILDATYLIAYLYKSGASPKVGCE